MADTGPRYPSPPEFAQQLAPLIEAYVSGKGAPKGCANVPLFPADKFRAHGDLPITPCFSPDGMLVYAVLGGLYGDQSDPGSLQPVPAAFSPQGHLHVEPGPLEYTVFSLEGESDYASPTNMADLGGYTEIHRLQWSVQYNLSTESADFPQIAGPLYIGLYPTGTGPTPAAYQLVKAEMVTKQVLAKDSSAFTAVGWDGGDIRFSPPIQIPPLGYGAAEMSIGVQGSSGIAVTCTGVLHVT
jgi:hypothetical protein